MKAKWNVITSTISSTTSVFPKLRKNNNVKMKANEIADSFNEHFINIGTKYLPACNNSMPGYVKLKDFISEHKPVDHVDVVFGIPFMGVDYVYKQFKVMSNSKATGLDMISIKLLKLSSSTVSKHTTGICNLSIQTGIFLGNWKIARVVPIFKSGNTTDFGNNRPISVLPICSKILERHVYDIIMRTYHVIIFY